MLELLSAGGWKRGVGGSLRRPQGAGSQELRAQPCSAEPPVLPCASWDRWRHVPSGEQASGL